MTHPATFEQGRSFLGDLLPRPIRTMRAFAEEEIVLPNGPYEGTKFRCERQPYGRLWLDAVDSRRWRRIATTGPAQSGKTLIGFVIPTLYHLFEMGETVIVAAPKMNVIADKWREDLRPVIGRTRYRSLLPQSGAGSKGGLVEAVSFANGATLRFMTGGGDDKSRASFTARVLIVTEVDGMDEAGGGSREADKISQLEARTMAFGDRAAIYLECTVSIETGRIWSEYQRGTASRIVRPCPHCGAWVTPEREHLVGWQSAQSLEEAREKSELSCPSCGEIWSEDDRLRANAFGKLLHRGQSIDDDGTVAGEPPRTDTLGIRWTAADNHFVSMAYVGGEEWRSGREDDSDNADRRMRQFFWTLPARPAAEQVLSLDVQHIVQRATQVPRGVVPAGTQWLTVGIDIGKHLCHWMAVAWRPGATPHVVDYGQLEVPGRMPSTEMAILAALREFRDQYLEPGWPLAGSRDSKSVDQAWIDSRYKDTAIYAFVRESPKKYRPMKGFGLGQRDDTGANAMYAAPAKPGGAVGLIGLRYHLVFAMNDKVWFVEVDANYWKTWAHERLAAPIGEPGAMTLYAGDPLQHRELAQQLTAETQTTEFIAGKGHVTYWKQVRRANHWFDALYIACAAGHFAGVRLLEPSKPPSAEPARERPSFTMPDGRPFLVTERS